jgi:hypothetical protein
LSQAQSSSLGFAPVDGTSVTLSDPATPFYATEAAPPDIDSMLDRLVPRIDFAPPLADFLYHDPYLNVRRMLQYGIYLGLNDVGGKSCHTLAFVEQDIDWQIWIETGPQLTPCAANPQSNPDGLPIGLSKSVIADPPRWKGEETGEFVGLNCAACHEGQLNYKGKHIRIEGGVGNMFDLMGYVYALDDAMQETLKEAAKFDRLAARLGANPDTKGKLRARFESEAAKVHEYRTRTLVTPPELGPLTS